MAQGARWLMSGLLMSGLGSSALEAFPGFVGGLLSGTVSGYLVARAGVVLQQRAAAVAEVRRLALEAARTFDGWTFRLDTVGGRNEYYLKGFYEIVARVGVPELEAPTDATVAPETASAAGDRGTPRSDAPGPQERLAKRRPWWWRVFEG